MIGGILNEMNSRTLKLLYEIKNDLKNLFPDVANKGITILTPQRLRKIFDKKNITEENLDKYFSDWCNKFPWGKKVESSVDNSDDVVSFYVKITPKSNEPYIIL